MDLLEPLMAVAIDVPEARMGAVITDISSKRRGTVTHFRAHHHSHEGGDVMAEVQASVPLAELIG